MGDGWFHGYCARSALWFVMGFGGVKLSSATGRAAQALYPRTEKRVRGRSLGRS